MTTPNQSDFDAAELQRQRTPEPEPILITQARVARKHTYSPYSRYPVGVALMAMEIGNPTAKIFRGTNIENASYGLTICAERVAIFSALAEGYDQFVELVCMTKDGGSSCGACRQVMLEFSENMFIFFVREDGQVTLTTRPNLLLPAPFTLKE